MKRLQALIYKLAYPLAQCYWFIVRPKTCGVKCILIHENQTLLIRHTYGSQLYSAVGGGIKAGENPEAAIKREIYEEVGLTVHNLHQVGTIIWDAENKHDTITVFVASTDSTVLTIDQAEIMEATWFEITDLPDDLSPLLQRYLSLAGIRSTMIAL